MKKTKNSRLWYNPKTEGRRETSLERAGLTGAPTTARERALLESYRRVSRVKQ